jgi:WS/DGAT/MGAT family acyltransferase
MRLSGTDASFVYTESASGPTHVASIYVVDGELPFDEIFEHFRARMHLIPRFTRRMVFVPFNLAHPKWVDDPEFDLANHVQLREIPEGSTLWDAVDAAMALNEPLLDRTQPMWKCHVVKGVPGKTLLLQIVHHAMIDGVSGVELSTIMFDMDPNAPDPAPPAEPWQPAPLPSAAELMTEAVRENLDNLSQRFARPTSRPSGDRRELTATATQLLLNFVLRPAITAPFNAGLVGPQRRFRWIKHDFAEAREVRRVLGGTVNDLVLTVVSEAAARYMEAKGVDVADQFLRIVCPVSVRREDEMGVVGNRVSAIFPVVPAWPMDVVERLNRVRRETERIKNGNEAQALTLLMEQSNDVPPLAMAPSQLIGTSFDVTALAARLPLPVLPQMATNLPNVGVNFTLTNVPGVQVPLYLLGRPIVDNVGVLLLTGNLGLGIAIHSYNKQLFYAFLCEPRLLPDLENLVEETERVVAELRTAAQEVAEQAAT